MNNDALTKRNKFIENVKEYVAFGDEPEITIIDNEGNKYEIIAYSDFVDFYDYENNYRKLEKIEDIFNYIKNDIEQYLDEFGADLTTDRDDHCKTGRCYPKFPYILYFTFSLVFIWLSTLPLYLFTEDSLIFKIIWTVIMTLVAIFFIINGIIFLQSYVITKDGIAIFCFGKQIESIDFSDCVFEIIELPTLYTRGVSIVKRKWICLYKRDESYKRFKEGCSNKKNNNRIQIIYSEEVLNILKNKKVRQM